MPQDAKKCCQSFINSDVDFWICYHFFGLLAPPWFPPECVAGVAVESVHVDLECGERDRRLLLLLDDRDLGLLLRRLLLRLLLLLLLSLLFLRWVLASFDLQITISLLNFSLCHDPRLVLGLGFRCCL